METDGTPVATPLTSLPRDSIKEDVMFPATVERVSCNTADEINERIRRQTEANVARFTGAGYAAITERLRELDQEWDIERVLETMAPTISIIGMVLGLTDNRKWFTVPLIVQTFFLQH